MKKYMVEDENAEFYQLQELYPDILDINIDKNLEYFKKFVQYFNKNLSKELLAAYIFYDYAIGYGNANLFGMAAIADYALEALQLLNLHESISFIERLYNHYSNGRNQINADAWEVFIKLYIGKMTVKDVINEEEERYRDIIKNLINKYYTYLEECLEFDALYYAIKYDYALFRTEYTNIISSKDALRKEKALYCANHIFVKKHSLSLH